MEYKVGQELDRMNGIMSCPYCESDKEMECEDTDLFGKSWTKWCPECELEIYCESKVFITDIQIKHRPTFEDEEFPTDEVICADCEKPAVRWIEDKSSRVGNHCGCWADCEACGTVTGVKSCPCTKKD